MPPGKAAEDGMFCLSPDSYFPLVKIGPTGK